MRSRLFCISCESYDSANWRLLESPEEMTKKEFDQLMEGIRDEEWGKLLKTYHANGFDLWEKILERLKNMGFKDANAFYYSIGEFDYWHSSGDEDRP